MVPIAHIENNFPTKFGIPRQSGRVGALKARIVFEPEYRNVDACRGLENYFLYVRLEPLYYSPFVTVQYLHSYESKSTRKNPACGILACSCQNTTRDSRLLNSYEISFIIAILV